MWEFATDKNTVEVVKKKQQPRQFNFDTRPFLHQAADDPITCSGKWHPNNQSSEIKV